MEFPFGHHHHTHHHRPEYGAGEEEEYLQPPPPPPLIHPPPPPPVYFHGENEPPPPAYFYGEAEPPPPRAQVHHISHADPPRPPPSSHVHHTSHVEDQGFGRENYTHEGPPYARPPPVSYSASAPVRHVSHHLNPQQPQGTEQVETHHLHHLPGFLHHHNEAHGVGSNLSNKPTVRVFCKAKPNHSLTILDGKVYLAPSDKTDMLQVLKNQSPWRFSLNYLLHLLHALNSLTSLCFFCTWLVVAALDQRWEIQHKCEGRRGISKLCFG